MKRQRRKKLNKYSKYSEKKIIKNYDINDTTREEIVIRMDERKQITEKEIYQMQHIK